MELIEKLLQERKKAKLVATISLISYITVFIIYVLLAIFTEITNPSIFLILIFVEIASGIVICFSAKKLKESSPNIRKELENIIISKLKLVINDDNIFTNTFVSLPRLDEWQFLLVVRNDNIKDYQLAKWLNPILDEINYHFRNDLRIHLHIL